MLLILLILCAFSISLILFGFCLDSMFFDVLRCWNEALSKAILSALLNAEKLDVGPNLTSFKDGDFPSRIFDLNCFTDFPKKCDFWFLFLWFFFCVRKGVSKSQEFTVGLDPQMKGLAISNSEPIRKASPEPHTSQIVTSFLSLWIQPTSPNSRWFRILFISLPISLSCCCSFNLAGSQLLPSTIIIRDCARQGCNCVWFWKGIDIS